jgi:hypothetical protein
MLNAPYRIIIIKIRILPPISSGSSSTTGLTDPKNDEMNDTIYHIAPTADGPKYNHTPQNMTGFVRGLVTDE